MTGSKQILYDSPASGTSECVTADRGGRVSDEVGKSRVGRVTRTARRLGFGSLMSSLLFSSRFVTIWLATLLLFIVCQIVAPETLSSTS